MSLQDIHKVFKYGKRAAESAVDATIIVVGEDEQREDTHVPEGAVKLRGTARYWAEWALAIIGHDGRGDIDTPQVQLQKLLAVNPAALTLPARMREYLATHGGSTRVFRLLGTSKEAICCSVRDIMLRETLGEWSCRGLVKETHTYLMATEELNFGEAPGFGNTQMDHYRQHIVRSMLLQPFSMLLFCIPGTPGDCRGASGDVTSGLAHSGVLDRFIKELEQSGETFPVLTVLPLDRFMKPEFPASTDGDAASVLATIRAELNHARTGPMNDIRRGLAFKTQTGMRVASMPLSHAEQERVKACINDVGATLMHTLAVDVSERLFPQCGADSDGHEFSLAGLIARLLQNKEAHAARLQRGAMRALVTDCMLPLFTTLTSQVGSFRAARTHGGLGGQARRLVLDLRDQLQAHFDAATAAAANAAGDMAQHEAALVATVVAPAHATATAPAILKRFADVPDYGKGKHMLRLDMLSKTPQDTPLRDVLLDEFVKMLLPFAIQLRGTTEAVLKEPVDTVHAFLNGWAANALAAVAPDDPLRTGVQAVLVALKASLADDISQKVRAALRFVTRSCVKHVVRLFRCGRDPFCVLAIPGASARAQVAEQLQYARKKEEDVCYKRVLVRLCFTLLTLNPCLNAGAPRHRPSIMLTTLFGSRRTPRAGHAHAVIPVAVLQARAGV
jgi:hypothetical protein